MTTRENPTGEQPRNEEAVLSDLELIKKDIIPESPADDAWGDVIDLRHREQMFRAWKAKVRDDAFETEIYSFSEDPFTKASVTAERREPVARVEEELYVRKLDRILERSTRDPIVYGSTFSAVSGLAKELSRIFRNPDKATSRLLDMKQSIQSDPSSIPQ